MTIWDIREVSWCSVCISDNWFHWCGSRNFSRYFSRGSRLYWSWCWNFWSWIQGSLYPCSILYKIERIDTVFCYEILVETSIDSFKKRITSFCSFCECKWPVWIKRCLFIVYLEMEMWSGCVPSESYSSYKCSLIYHITWLYDNLREMEIARIIFAYLTLVFHIFVFDGYVFIIWIIFCTDDFPMSYSKYWCTNRRTDIDTIMRSCVWSSFFIHIAATEDCQIGEHAIEICLDGSDWGDWYEVILIDDSVVERCSLIDVVSLFPIWHKCERHHSSVKWFCVVCLRDRHEPEMTRCLHEEIGTQE